MDKEVLTIKQVAEFLQMAYRTIYNLAKQREIPAFKVGSDWRFLKKDIENWIEQKKSELAGQVEQKKSKSRKRSVSNTDVQAV